jgi:hypothetical protein
MKELKKIITPRHWHARTYLYRARKHLIPPFITNQWDHSKTPPPLTKFISEYFLVKSMPSVSQILIFVNRCIRTEVELLLIFRFLVIPSKTCGKYWNRSWRRLEELRWNQWHSVRPKICFQLRRKWTSRFCKCQVIRGAAVNLSKINLRHEISFYWLVFKISSSARNKYLRAPVI